MDEFVGLLRYALGATLALAVAWKVRDFTAFRRSLSEYGLHRGFGWAGAVALIAAEALAAVAAFRATSDLMVGIFGAGLGLGFSVAQTYLLSTGQPVPCLCFGAAAAEPASYRTWSRSVLVLGAGLLLVFTGRSGPRPSDPVLVAGGLILVGLVATAYHRTARPGTTGTSPAAPPGSRVAT